MDRNRIVVITDPATAEGFLLTGVDVQSFVDPREARDEICRMLKDGSTEILVANDNFLDGVEDWVRQHMKSSSPPVLISLPIVRNYGRPSPSSIRDTFRKIDAALGVQDRGAAADAQKHHVTHHELEARTCRTCGHLMEPGMRICYECGSIQRGARAKGMHSTPSKTASCHMCCAQIPDYKTMCEKCSAIRKKQTADAKSPDTKVVAPEEGTSLLRALVARIRRFLHRLRGSADRTD